MAKLNMEEVHEHLTKRVEEYIDIIKKEYWDYLPFDVRFKLKKIDDYGKILKIYDTNVINGYATEEAIFMPLCADKILNKVSKIPGYGLKKEHKPYTNETMVINDNTFSTYIKHVFISGTNAEGYYEDLLLHETMHYCGSDGSSSLKEGLNELLTRMLAQKYDLRINACGYPKEVKLNYKLMQVFGEDIMKKLAFTNGIHNECLLIRNELGPEAEDFYRRLSDSVQEEFHNKYYKHMDDFTGLSGIYKKIKAYDKIDYSDADRIIDDYVEKIQKQEQKTI